MEMTACREACTPRVQAFGTGKPLHAKGTGLPAPRHKFPFIIGVPLFSVDSKRIQHQQAFHCFIRISNIFVALTVETHPGFNPDIQYSMERYSHILCLPTN